MATRQIPWARVLVEGVVIVVSILLALAAQAWWEGRQERRQEADYLAALRRELESGLPDLSGVEDGLERALHGHEKLIGQFREAAGPPEDSLLYWLSGLSYPARLNPPIAVLNDLVSSGGIQLIRDDELRLAVADYSRSLESYRGAADQAWATWTDRIQPFLETRVSRVDRLREGSYPRSVPFDSSPFGTDYRRLFDERAFESMVAERWSRLDGARVTLGQLRGLMTDIIEMIDSELGRSPPMGSPP